MRSFESLVVLTELSGVDGPIIPILASIRYSSGEGLYDIEVTFRCGKARCPRILLAMDVSEHNPYHGPPSVVANKGGTKIEDFVSLWT